MTISTFHESDLSEAVRGGITSDLGTRRYPITPKSRADIQAGNLAGRLQSDAAHWCLLILSLSKDACSSCRWFDRLAMNGLEKTLQSSWGTWDEGLVKEASYVLRIAADGLLLDGEFHDPFSKEKLNCIQKLGRKFGWTFIQKLTEPRNYIQIDPGKIAILSTIEELHMPADLVGKIGIRLQFAHLGLTGLMGIQVDPLFGHDKERERLYIRVANFGSDPIRLSEGDGVFTFELHEVTGSVGVQSKEDSWPRIKETLKNLDDASWSYVTQVESDLSAETQSVKDYFQPLVMFGVFLVAVSILAAALSVLLQTPNPSEVIGSSLIALEARTLMLWVIIVGIAGTAWVGIAAGWRFFRPYRRGTARANTGLIRKCWRKFWHWLW